MPAVWRHYVIKSITTMMLRLLGFLTSTLCCLGQCTLLCGSKWQAIDRQLITPFNNLPLWRSRQRVSPQRRLLSAVLHGVILQKAVIFISHEIGLLLLPCTKRSTNILEKGRGPQGANTWYSSQTVNQLSFHCSRTQIVHTFISCIPDCDTVCSCRKIQIVPTDV